MTSQVFALTLRVCYFRLRWLTPICISVLFLLARPTLASTQPREQVETYHEPFKGKLQKAEDFKFVGPDAEKFVLLEPEGLRIKLPLKRPPTGLATAFGVTGDFEITVGYEILQEPKMADAGGSGGTKISLTVNMNRPGANDASIRRKVMNSREPHIVTWRRLRKNLDSPPEDFADIFPAKAKTGRFRLVRTGAEVAYYLSEGDEGEFRKLRTFPLGEDDVKNVQLVAETGSDTAMLDVRFTNLQIRAASLPRTLRAPIIDSSDTKVPDKDYAQTYAQPFKGTDLRPEGWNFASRLSEEAVQFEPAGLRFTLPPGSPKVQSAGILSAFGVKGDFEITMSFEILKDPDPADAGKAGTRLSLAVTLDSPSLDTPQSEVSTLSRSMSTKGFVTWMRNRDKPASITHTFPTPAMNGRLRMVRSGDELYHLASVGADQPLQYLKKYRFGAENLKRVVITTSTGGEQAFLDLRVTDFRIRADAIPGAPDVVTAGERKNEAAAPPAPPERSRIWLVGGAGVALAILVVLALALLLRRRGGVPAAPVGGEIATVAFACPKCAKALKSKMEMAGRNVKCPKCGSAVLVPSAETSKS